MSFSAEIDTAKRIIGSYTNHKIVRLSSLVEYFSEPAEVDKMLKDKNDLIVYEYFEKIFKNEEKNMNFGLTIIYPGKVGKEYFMTRGHFHEKSAAEIYIGLDGEGMVLMQSKTGIVELQPLKPNTVVYVPPNWGHRTINTGKRELVFLFIYPSDAGHDYDIVKEKGFAKLVVEENGRVVLIDNPKYRR